MKIVKKLCYAGIAILMAASIGSCGQPDKPASTPPPNKPKDTLAYNYRGFKQRDPTCGSKPDSSCAIVSNQYPWFTNAPALNTYVLQMLGNKVKNITEPDTILKRGATDFFREYLTDTDAVSNHRYYESTDTILVLHQDSALIGFSDQGYVYMGGAHGQYNTAYINWDLKAKRQITLKELLVDNYQQKLNATAEILFRRQENISADQSLKDNYFFKDNKFSLNENFLITSNGLLFLYNPYEIKPYSEGQTKLLVPYAQIKTLLRPKGLLSQYIK